MNQEQEQFFNLAYSKGYNFEIMNDTSILKRIKKVVEVYYDLNDLSEKSRVEPLPTARKIYVKLANEKYRGKVKNVVALIGKNHASYSTDLKAANGFLEVDKRFIVDYNRICNALEHSYDLDTPKYALNLNVTRGMLIKERIDEVINGANEMQSPIFFGELHYTITKGRQKVRGVASKIVMKGTQAEILNDKKAKRSALLDYFGGTKEAKKKVYKFDLDKIKLTKTVFNKFLGYGVIESKKSRW